MNNELIKIAEGAGQILMKYFKHDFEIQTKGDKFDLVTTADIESDQYIRTELKKLFPDDLILSEESLEIPADFYGDVWMVDPLDGTKGFVNKNPSFAVMIGLCRAGIPILGIVYIPAKDKLYYAEKGKGAFLREGNDIKKILVSEISMMDKATLISYNRYGEKRVSDQMIDNMPVLKRIPESSAGVKLCLVAEGKAEVHVHTNSRGSKWDTCAPQIILEEAGGKITNHKGEHLNYLQKEISWKNGFVGTNNLLHKNVIEYLEGYS